MDSVTLVVVLLFVLLVVVLVSLEVLLTLEHFELSNKSPYLKQRATHNPIGEMLGLIPVESVMIGDTAVVLIVPVVAGNDPFVAAPPGILVGLPFPVVGVEVLEADVLDAGTVTPFSKMMIGGGGVVLLRIRISYEGFSFRKKIIHAAIVTIWEDRCFAPLTVVTST